MTVLSCSDLCKNFGRAAALDGVTLSIEPGRIVGLLGPTGGQRPADPQRREY